MTKSEVPNDRPIDDIDQIDDSQVREIRTSVLHQREDLLEIKWKEWKLYLVWEPNVNQSSDRLESPYLFNAMRDPKEESGILAFNTWVLQPTTKFRTEFQRSLARDPAPPSPLRDFLCSNIDVNIIV
ncbi:arylsulfatase A [Colletotrichum orchidophilum]|uniref:Arylsulfatase A n=1 Tax=Colletotrichum orchidophilum TaxID=1209926 RepID=A0A1G4B710_9PEZI|nr:arylsulfatase A [Colletotrichum orchidophilum]OHE97055.1 arylsulfatase A [Colletotrichum orchidophilum]